LAGAAGFLSDGREEDGGSGDRVGAPHHFNPYQLADIPDVAH